MTFSDFVRTASTNQIVFKNTSPIERVGKVNFYSDDSSGSFKKEFRWSFNGTYWSSWEKLTQANVSSIKMGTKDCLYMEVRYVGVGKVTTFTLNYSEASAIVTIKPAAQPAYFCEIPDPSVVATSKDLSCKDIADYGKTCDISKETLIGCNMLDGKPGSYYLWRPNHLGQQTISTIVGLEDRLNQIVGYINGLTIQDASNLGLNVGNAVGVYEKHDSKILWFRSLVPGNKIMFDAKNHENIKIYVDDASFGDIYTLLGYIDASLVSINNWLARHEVSIGAIDSSLTVLNAWISSIDSSFNALDGVNTGTGSPVFTQRIGDNFLYKTIRGTSGIQVQSTGAEILLSFDASTAGAIYNSTLDPSITAPVDVGGIPAGTSVGDLLGKPLAELWDELLFPTVFPTYVAPSASFTMSPAITLYEVSTNIPNLTFTTTLNRGQILLNGKFQDFRSGEVTGYSFTGSGLVDVSTNVSPYVAPSISYDVQFLSQSWSAVVHYGEGPQPFDSKSNPSGTPLPAGSVLATPTHTINGSYPYFATTVDINTLTKLTLLIITQNPYPSALSVLTGIALVAETGGNKQKFDIPNPRLSISTLKGIRTLNTIGNQWEYQGGTAAISLTYWDTSQVTHEIQGYTIPYTRYTYNGVDRSNVTIKLEF